MLSSYRVVDLSDERGQLCGHILASLGADVVVVEPPGGSSARRTWPFWGDPEEPGPDDSLFWLAYNRGKRSVVADAHTPGGKTTIEQLAAGADILIESAGPGVMDGLGLGDQHLRPKNPALIYVSISGYGGSGPKAHWDAPDLVAAAAGGPVFLSGDEDRPPVRVSLPQSYHNASVDAAGATLIALHERQRHSGLGQHIDVSAQHSMTQGAQSFLLSHGLNAEGASRVAAGVRIAGIDAEIQFLWPCADGHVSATVLFGAVLGPPTRRLMEWVHEEGFCDEATRDKDWIEYANMLISGEEPVSEYERVKKCLGAFFATKTKVELAEAAFTRHVLLAPANTTADVLASPHFQDRELWEDVDHGERGTLRYPGRYARFSATPLPTLPAAPSLGQHTGEVLAEPARQPAVPKRVAEGSASSVSRPLEGLKVADFMWVFAGPMASRVLADHGATVVRVESPSHLDALRTAGNFKDCAVDVEMALQFSNVNAGKLGLALELGNPAARDVALDLVRWADVVTESFTPKVMAGFGLDYQTLRQVKPDLIMASSCLMGQTGPHRLLAGYGTMGAAVSGWFPITGWPDRGPASPFLAYTDYVAPRFLLTAIMAALEHHRVTGEGQYIDLSQAEATMQLLTPALLDVGANGRVMERCGNDDPVFAPHGVYPAAGTDRWVAIAVTSDEAWKALSGLVGRSDLADLDAEARRGRRRELDDVVAGWTRNRDVTEIAETLQSHGVAADAVVDSELAWSDPQLRYRGHFWPVTHSAQGDTFVEGPRWRLSRTPSGPARGAPTIGEHNFEVLSEILGYDTDRIAEVAAAEALG